MRSRRTVCGCYEVKVELVQKLVVYVVDLSLLAKRKV